MDGYATGTAGAGGAAQPPAVVSKKLELIKLSKIDFCLRLYLLKQLIHLVPTLSTAIKAGFDPVKATAWRSTNFALRKSMEVFLHIGELSGSGYDLCMAACTVVTPICPICIPFTVVDIITENAIFAVLLALDISEHVYAEIVDGQDGDAAAEQDSATYLNVITTHGNVIAVGQLVENLLTIHGVPKTGSGFSRRRLQVIDCISMTLGNDYNCTTKKPLCEDPTKLCDGSINYKYISQLKRGENDTRLPLRYFQLCRAHNT